MPKLIFLGTGYAVPDESHENTHLAIIGRERCLLVDCVGNPFVRLRQAGIDPLGLTDLVLTHFHPDHVSGVPSFLMGSWLQGRKLPLTIYGLAHTLDRMEGLMVAYGWQRWPDFFPVTFQRLPAKEMAPVFASEELCVFASPVQHMIPTIGLRIEFPQTSKILAYSCDTEPTPAVVELASGADVLIHEATGIGLGHSSAQQAGGIARQAEVGRLFLIHYPPGEENRAPLLAQAGITFPGPVVLAEDFMEIEF